MNCKIIQFLLESKIELFAYEGAPSDARKIKTRRMNS